MIRINNIKLAPGYSTEQLYEAAAKKLHTDVSQITTLKIARRSVDARKKDDIRVVFQLDVDLEKNAAREVLKRHDKDISMTAPKPYIFPAVSSVQPDERPVVAGMGPAGLFCACHLAQAGLDPIVIERGAPIPERSAAVNAFWQGGPLDPENNVQFGEGGAGTFSDGKLNTAVKDTAGRGRRVLELFVRYGAPSDILYEQRPHIGTDVLKDVIMNMRGEMAAMGADIRFHTKLSAIEHENGRLTGIRVTGPGGAYRINTGRLILALGHSSRDTFEMLERAGLDMEAKAFAVGLRIEHPQSMIQLSQYGAEYAGQLPPASYRLTAQASDGRGVYTFCMCPGGKVVNASSEPGRLAVNGMSYRARDGKNANSAVVVTVTPKDFEGQGVLAGMAFQRRLEERAYAAAGGLIPVCMYGDFKAGVTPSGLCEVLPDTMGPFAVADLGGILPGSLKTALCEGMLSFGRKIEGFDRYDAVFSAVESRTSSPVRITRGRTLQSNISGIFPCGEGAGYAGGITSAAIDGIRVAEAVAGSAEYVE